MYKKNKKKKKTFFRGQSGGVARWQVPQHVIGGQGFGRARNFVQLQKNGYDNGSYELPHVGDQSAMLPSYHDENRHDEANRVHRFSQEVIKIYDP